MRDLELALEADDPVKELMRDRALAVEFMRPGLANDIVIAVVKMSDGRRLIGHAGAAGVLGIEAVRLEAVKAALRSGEKKTPPPSAVESGNPRCARPGVIVDYRLRELDAERICDLIRKAMPGVRPTEGEVRPMMITGVHNGLVSGRIFADGSVDYWICGREQGAGVGEWCWPPRD